jgi:hypothetical protein
LTCENSAISVVSEDDVIIILIDSSLFDHPPKALAHLLKTFVHVLSQVMGARFIAALLLRFQA